MDMFPFFRRPYYYYARNNYINPNYNIENEDKRKNQRQDYINSNSRKNNEEDKRRGNTERKEKIQLQGETHIFEIFGIKLYFDDILLIALIFFLYNEGVEDNLLFISLILLLLS